MKIWRLALAVLLAAGTVAAYVYFPNPLELASQDEDARPAVDLPVEKLPAGGGETT